MVSIMGRGSFRMQYDTLQNLKTSNGVAVASYIAEKFTKRLSTSTGDKTNAVRRLSIKAGVAAGFINRLLQPSRRPKTVDADILAKLKRAWLADIALQISELELEAQRLREISDVGDSAVTAALAKAEALCAELKQLL